ncbi:MAG: hypothetical protein ACO1QB_10945 [Verrucomicrobiales bacterium]
MRKGYPLTATALLLMAVAQVLLFLNLFYLVEITKSIYEGLKLPALPWFSALAIKHATHAGALFLLAPTALFLLRKVFKQINAWTILLTFELMYIIVVFHALFLPLANILWKIG